MTIMSIDEKDEKIRWIGRLHEETSTDNEISLTTTMTTQLNAEERWLRFGVNDDNSGHDAYTELVKANIKFFCKQINPSEKSCKKGPAVLKIVRVVLIFFARRGGVEIKVPVLKKKMLYMYRYKYTVGVSQTGLQEESKDGLKHQPKMNISLS